MNIFEILADVLSFFGAPRADNDRFIVGKSPIEQGIASFWRRLGFLLLLAASAAALYVWVLQPRLAPFTSRQATPLSATLTQ